MDGEEPYVGVPNLRVGHLVKVETERLLDQLEHPVEDRVEREVLGHLERVHPVVGPSLLRVVVAPVPDLYLALAMIGFEQLAQRRHVERALLGQGRDQ